MTRARRHVRPHLRQVLLGLTLATIGAIQPPVNATATTLPSTMGIAATFEGTGTLPTFPCGEPFPCTGSLSGNLAGTVSGIDVSGNPYLVTFPDPTAGLGAASPNMSASIGYQDVCAGFPEVWPLTGTASVTMTATGGLLVDNGVASHNATATVTFGWLREGVILVYTTAGGKVLNGTGATVATSAVFGGGVGIFVPLGGLADCSNIQSNYPFRMVNSILTPA
jgi:hypothetical protein